MGIVYDGNRRYPFRGRRDAYVEVRGREDFVAVYDDKRVCSFAYLRHALRCLQEKERNRRAQESASRGHDRG